MKACMSRMFIKRREILFFTSGFSGKLLHFIFLIISNIFMGSWVSPQYIVDTRYDEIINQTKCYWGSWKQVLMPKHQSASAPFLCNSFLPPYCLLSFRVSGALGYLGVRPSAVYGTVPVPSIENGGSKRASYDLAKRPRNSQVSFKKDLMFI